MVMQKPQPHEAWGLLLQTASPQHERPLLHGGAEGAAMHPGCVCASVITAVKVVTVHWHVGEEGQRCRLPCSRCGRCIQSASLSQVPRFAAMHRRCSRFEVDESRGGAACGAWHAPGTQHAPSMGSAGICAWRCRSSPFFPGSPRLRPHSAASHSSCITQQLHHAAHPPHTPHHSTQHTRLTSPGPPPPPSHTALQISWLWWHWHRLRWRHMCGGHK